MQEQPPARLSAELPEFLPNPGMFIRPHHLPPSAWAGHIPFAGWLVEALRPRTLVELGSHHGTSYLAFCQAVVEAHAGTNCRAVDTWQGDDHAGAYGEEVYENLRAIHDPAYGSFSELLRMTFDQALACFADGSVDLLHIDGLHTYEAVQHDFETWRPKLSGRAVVLFHDIQVRDRAFGVWRLWEELKDSYPHFEFRHAHGLGVLLVGGEHGDAVRALAALPEIACSYVRDLFAALGAGIERQARILELEASLAGTGRGLDEYRRHATGLEEDCSRLRTELAALDAAVKARAREVDEHAQLVAKVHVTLEAERARHEALLAQAGEAHARAIDALRAQSEAMLNVERGKYETLLADTDQKHARAVEALRQQSDAALAALAVQADKMTHALSAKHAAHVEEVRAVHEQTVAMLRSELEACRALVEDRDRQLVLVYGSRSWRITGWLRALGRVLRGGA